MSIFGFRCLPGGGGEEIDEATLERIASRPAAVRSARATPPSWPASTPRSTAWSRCAARARRCGRSSNAIRGRWRGAAGARCWCAAPAAEAAAMMRHDRAVAGLHLLRPALAVGAAGLAAAGPGSGRRRARERLAHARSTRTCCRTCWNGRRTRLAARAGIGLAWRWRCWRWPGRAGGRASNRCGRPQSPLVMALDLSGAMLAPICRPSRLLQARAKIARCCAQRNGGQVGAGRLSPTMPSPSRR
jgi:hypothetical protein